MEGLTWAAIMEKQMRRLNSGTAVTWGILLVVIVGVFAALTIVKGVN